MKTFYSVKKNPSTNIFYSVIPKPSILTIPKYNHMVVIYNINISFHFQFFLLYITAYVNLNLAVKDNIHSIRLDVEKNQYSV